MDIKCVINTRQLRLVRTGVADKPKALPNWLRANLRKLVELYIKVSIYYYLKGSPGLHKGFLWGVWFKSTISKLSVGKIFNTVHHHGIEKKFPGGF